MYLARHVGGWSTTRIGRFYNGRDHSTVCHALKRVAARREDDPEVDGLVSSLAAEIKTAGPKENAHTELVQRAGGGAGDPVERRYRAVQPRLRRSHASEKRRLRSTVRPDTSRSPAISSTVQPKKNRSSTMRVLAGSTSANSSSARDRSK